MTPGMLKSLSVVYFIFEFLDLLWNLGFSQLDLFFPPLSGVEFFIIFLEIETAIIKTFCEVFIRYVFTCFVEFLFALVKFLNLLIQSGKDDFFGNDRLWYHNVENVLIRVNFRKYFLYEGSVEIFIFLYSRDGALEWTNSLINFVLFLLVFEELFFEFVFSRDDKISFRPQRDWAADSV